MEYPGDDSAQSLGEFTTTYSLYPHAGGWCDAPISLLAQQNATPLRLVQLGRQEGPLPASKSFVTLSNGKLIVSCLKKAQDRPALMLRVFNPTDEDLTTNVELGFDVQGARLCWMSEEPLSSVEVRNGRSLTLAVPHKKIVTVELTLA
jgi:alpha-mannosidase